MYHFPSFSLKNDTSLKNHLFFIIFVAMLLLNLIVDKKEGWKEAPLQMLMEGGHTFLNADVFQVIFICKWLQKKIPA